MAPLGLITTIEEKLELVAAMGVDQALVIHFDHGLSQMTAADFVQIVLKGRVGMRRIVVGFNHGFGRHRTGDRETLIAMSKNLNFTVDVVNPTHVGDAIVSSTRIRRLLADGKVTDVAETLGRYHSVKGVVVRGFGRGKRLHWPTANLGLIAPGKLCPLDGTYAGLANLQGETHPAAISMGFNPTFTEAKHSVEAHLIGFDRDIYDEEMEIEFVERIRGEKKFSGEAELSAQIANDVQAASQILKMRGLVRQIP
ncbi:bifunctional riboflavin kinase/FMN adenylyltransferase [bacterium]|nr:bifunctional riboflavin kinase/FMN adenylyltransferase [bacterium]